MTDDRDDRLRRLLSALPRVKAPHGFEETLLRRIARERPPRRALPAWLGTYTAPALSLLLVGALSYLVYMTQFRVADGSLRKGSDTIPIRGGEPPPAPAAGDGSRTGSDLPRSPGGDGLTGGESSVPAVEQPPVRQQAGRAEDLRLEGGIDLASPSLEGRTALRTQGYRGPIAPGAPASPKSFFRFGPAGLMNAGGARPGGRVIGRGAAAGAAAADSTGVRDSAAADTAHPPPGTGRDSVPDRRRPEPERER